NESGSGEDSSEDSSNSAANLRIHRRVKTLKTTSPPALIPVQAKQARSNPKISPIQRHRTQSREMMQRSRATNPMTNRAREQRKREQRKRERPKTSRLRRAIRKLVSKVRKMRPKTVPV